MTNARRSRQANALRRLGCAFSRAVVSGEVLTMLIKAGKLQDRDGHTDIEIERALTEFLFEQAGERKLQRVSSVMRARWHPDQNQECSQ